VTLVQRLGDSGDGAAPTAPEGSDPIDAALLRLGSRAVPEVAAALAAELVADPYRWLRTLFPSYVAHAFGGHHEVFWAWIWGIDAGERADSLIAIWPRAGGKSTAAELAVVALGARGARRYVVYCSRSQRQADDHVANIAGLLSTPRLAAVYPELGERMLSKFGTSLGWRRTRLRTASGLIVDAMGLDAAMRGMKLGEDRPDLIVLDDLDDALDTPRTTERKLIALTRSVLPAQSEHGTVLGIQNLVIPDGIFARLAGVASTDADFLIGRRLVGPVPNQSSTSSRRPSGRVMRCRSSAPVPTRTTWTHGLRPSR